MTERVTKKNQPIKLRVHVSKKLIHDSDDIYILSQNNEELSEHSDRQQAFPKVKTRGDY